MNGIFSPFCRAALTARLHYARVLFHAGPDRGRDGSKARVWLARLVLGPMMLADLTGRREQVGRRAASRYIARQLVRAAPRAVDAAPANLATTLATRSDNHFLSLLSCCARC